MNATTTALRVLRWALAGGTGPVPAGPLSDAAGLVDPGDEVRDTLAELLRRYAARAGAGRPPFGDPARPGAGAVLLAAAIGGRKDPDTARTVAEALPPPRLGDGEGGGWSDALARHAIVAPYASLPSSADDEAAQTPLLDALLDASPLTGVLLRPSARRLSHGTGAVVRAAAALTDRPGGRELLCSALSPWCAFAAVLDWRAHLLDRLAHDRPDVVADTYLSARLRHGPEWDEQLHAARRRLAAAALADELTLATVRFWAPLGRLARRHRDLVASRPFLDGHQPAVTLAHRYRLAPSTTG